MTERSNNSSTGSVSAPKRIIPTRDSKSNLAGTTRALTPGMPKVVRDPSGAHGQPVPVSSSGTWNWQPPSGVKLTPAQVEKLLPNSPVWIVKGMKNGEAVKARVGDGKGRAAFFPEGGDPEREEIPFDEAEDRVWSRPEASGGAGNLRQGLAGLQIDALPRNSTVWMIPAPGEALVEATVANGKSRDFRRLDDGTRIGFCEGLSEIHLATQAPRRITPEKLGSADRKFGVRHPDEDAWAYLERLAAGPTAPPEGSSTQRRQQIHEAGLLPRMLVDLVWDYDGDPFRTPVSPLESSRALQRPPAHSPTRLQGACWLKAGEELYRCNFLKPDSGVTLRKEVAKLLGFNGKDAGDGFNVICPSEFATPGISYHVCDATPCKVAPAQLRPGDHVRLTGRRPDRSSDEWLVFHKVGEERDGVPELIFYTTAEHALSLGKKHPSVEVGGEVLANEYRSASDQRAWREVRIPSRGDLASRLAWDAMFSDEPWASALAVG